MSSSALASRRTPLFDAHKKAGARFTEFSGWEMPAQYTGIVDEHQAVRRRCGLFDISHMGQIFVEGRDALPFLQKICTNDISKCDESRAMYSHLCNEAGGVVDDIFVYCFSRTRYLVIVNAATADKDYRWMLKHKIAQVEIGNKSDDLSMVALQGPLAESVASKLFPALPQRHQVLEQRFMDETMWLCRTGYTGEDGFEIITSNGKIAKMWDLVLEAGKDSGVLPCGLGARDTLRLEAGYLLYGQDVDDDHTPLEAGVSWVVKFDKGDFIGRAALAGQKAKDLDRKLAAFQLTGRGVPRHGYKILAGGREVGAVTSGTFSPSLQAGIALGYVAAGAAGELAIECRGNTVPARRIKLPFYSKGSKA